MDKTAPAVAALPRRVRLKTLLLCGGRKSRLWPESTSLLPGQFVGGQDSLVYRAYQRLRHSKFLREEDIIFTLLESQRGLLESLLGVVPDERLILQAQEERTLVALAAAARCLQDVDNCVLASVPCDHWVPDDEESRLQEALVFGAQAAFQENRLVILGASIRRPETGFGYVMVQPGAHEHISLPGKAGGPTYRLYKAERFEEKPDASRAQQYMRDGRWFWNTDIIVCRPKVLLQELAHHHPALRRLLDDISGPEWVRHLFLRSQPSTPAKDLLSRSGNVHVMPVPFLWDDTGTWAGRARVAEDSDQTDQNNNTKAQQGQSLVFLDAKGTFIHSHGDRTIAVVGLNDIVIVDAKDALLVCAKANATEVGAVPAVLAATPAPKTEP